MIARNEYGCLIVGANHRVGGCTIEDLEIKVILLGIRLAIEKGWSNVAIEGIR